MTQPGTLGHLARRFFEVARARRPGPVQQRRVATLLSPAEAALFFDQSPADQAHALACMGRVARVRPGSPALHRAALLHDVGKRHASLGLVARTLASLLGLARLPAPGRLGTYLDHGPLGAADLRAAGSDPLSIAFAGHHHGERPQPVDPDDWRVLCDADKG